MAVNCPNCGKPNPDEAYICQFCDTPLVTYVPHPIPDPDQPPEKPAEPEAPAGSPEWLEQLRLKKLEDEQKLGRDYFNRFGPVEPIISTPPAEDGTGQGLDDWLTKVRTNLDDENLTPSEATTGQSAIPAESSTADWLTTIRNRATSEGITPPQPTPITDDADDWLNKLRKQTDQLKPPEENPQWIQALNEPQMPIPPFDGDLPVVDDLADTFIEDEPEEEYAPPEMGITDSTPPSPVANEELLSFSIYSNPIREEPEHPIPEQLRNSIPQIDADAFAEDFLPPEEELLEMQDEPRERIPTRDIPNWLTSILGENEAEAAPLTAISAGNTSEEPPAEGSVPEVEPGKIPGWVQAMRPIDTTTPIPTDTTSTDRHVEEAGPLAGIRGIIPGETVLPSYTSLSTLDLTSNTGKTKQNVAFFNEILATESQTGKVPTYQRTRQGGTIRWLMMIFLTAIMLLPLISGIQTNALPSSIPIETANLFKAISSLPEDSRVIVVVDYEPAYAGELQTAAAPILNHLMVKQADLYLVSTSPTGPLLANQLLASVAAFPQTFQSDYLNGEKFTVLGYLPGEQAGILSLNSSLTQAIPITLNLGKTTDLDGLAGPSPVSSFQAILVISDHPDTIRGWIEQIQGGLPVWAVSNAQSAPQLRPYVRSGQLAGFLAGNYGGTVYERIFQQPGIAWRQWNVFYTGLLAGIILIIGGGILNYLGQLILKGRKKKSA